MKTIQAIFENGVFRPTEPVELPEHCAVEFEPRPAGNGPVGPWLPSDLPPEPTTPEEIERRERALNAIYEILGRRYSSGETDVAERHNEHQP